MLRSALVVLAFLGGVACVIGWSLELPTVDATVNAGELIIRAATVGAGAGLVVGLLSCLALETFLGRFQAIATAIILFTIGAPLLALVTNRSLGADQTIELQLPVKQVTAEWSGRGLTREALDQPADGYSIYVETDEGLLRLRQDGGEAPEINATRSLPVFRNPGYWGYPLYELAPVDTTLVPAFE